VVPDGRSGATLIPPAFGLAGVTDVGVKGYSLRPFLHNIYKIGSYRIYKLGGNVMESHAKVLGHPIHPMLVVFPLGLLAASLGFDAGFLSTNNAQFAIVSFWIIGAGILGGLLAAVFGAIDWWAIPRNTRAWAIATFHGIGNLIVVLLFFANWFLRLHLPGNQPQTTEIVLSCIAVALALVTGWLGGELVDRLGVGVDDGANLNAPNSLLTHSTEPQTRHI
jgi:uncharacterized membrane protein